MKIRNRTTLWITGVGLLASLLFSLVVFYEVIEEPNELLDAELDIQAHTLLDGLEFEAGVPSFKPETMLITIGRFYWFKIFNEQGKVIYASDLSRLVELPLLKKHRGYTVTTRTPNHSPTINLNQDDNGNVTFRVQVLTINSGGHSYKIQIAKSVGNLEEEISGLLLALLLGLFVSAVILVSVGYYVAGRILEPISTINALVREINDKTLDQRIPLGKTQDELHELSSSLNKMFDRLQHSFTRQKEFVANASHELKTPLTMLRLFFDENMDRKDLPEPFRERLMIQGTTLARMDQLVKNLLDLSTLELQNTTDRESYDLVRQIHAVLTEFKEIFEIENIRVTTNMPGQLFLNADREKIRRVLINIIDNAIKYNQPGGEIGLEIIDGNSRITLELCNTGLGVPDRDLEKVFDQFYRVEKSRSSAHGGSGLGLSIVKRTIELHNGTITMTSKAGEWANIQIILPKNC